MKGFVQDVEGLAVEDGEFRRVLHTARHCRAEVHELDQFFCVEAGTGEVILDGVRTEAGFAVLVPAGTNHDIKNTGRGFAATRRPTASTSTGRRRNEAAIPAGGRAPSARGFL